MIGLLRQPALAAVSLGLASVIATAVAATAPIATDAAEATVEAAWYADGSCLLRMEGAEQVGITAIDADMGDGGARTMVHCDVEDGRRITVLMRGDGLAIGERVVLAEPGDIDEDVDGSVAWIAPHDPDADPSIDRRRFVTEGRILIRDTPATDASDNTLHADKLPFAEMRGRLEPLQRHPGHASDRGDAPAAIEQLDPAGATRLACRDRPCNGDGAR